MVTVKLSHFIFINCDEDSSAIKDKYQDISNYCVGSSIQSEYNLALNKPDLIRVMEDIIERQKTTRIYPLIHIESHGSKAGLLLKSGGRISWQSLFRYISTINLNARNNLVVFLASCSGGFATVQLIEYISEDRNSKRAPALMVIGPKKDISYEELNFNTDRFYENLFYSPRDMDAAIRSLDNDKFFMSTCVDIYKTLVNNYVESDIQEKFSSKLKFDIYIFSLLKENFRRNGVMANQTDYIKFARLVTNEEIIIGELNNLRRLYLMIDLYPENDSNFPKVDSIPSWRDAVSKVWRQ